MGPEIGKDRHDTSAAAGMVLHLRLVDREPAIRPVDVVPLEIRHLAGEADSGVPRQRENHSPLIVGAGSDDLLDRLRRHIDDPGVVLLRAAGEVCERIDGNQPSADGGLKELPCPPQIDRGRRRCELVEEPPLIGVGVPLADRGERPVLAKKLLDQAPGPGIVPSSRRLLLAEGAEELGQMLPEGVDDLLGPLSRRHEACPGEPGMDLVTEAADPIGGLAVGRVASRLGRLERLDHPSRGLRDPLADLAEPDGMPASGRSDHDAGPPPAFQFLPTQNSHGIVSLEVETKKPPEPNEGSGGVRGDPLLRLDQELIEAGDAVEDRVAKLHEGDAACIPQAVEGGLADAELLGGVPRTQRERLARVGVIGSVECGGVHAAPGGPVARSARRLAYPANIVPQVPFSGAASLKSRHSGARDAPVRGLGARQLCG